jgi:hypothetical protein
MRSVESAEIEKIGRRIGDAALDPGLWPAIMEEICHAAGATGSALLQADVRTPDIPRTASVDELFSAYFHDSGTPETFVCAARHCSRGVNQ